MKDNVREETEELFVVNEVIQTFDVRQMIDQLLRSLRLKCKGLNKLGCNTFKIRLYLFDEGTVEGFEHVFDPPTLGHNEEQVDSKNHTNDSRNDKLFSLSICGADDNKVTDNKKLKAYIKSVVKTEKCEQDSTGIKTESIEKTQY